MLLCNTKTQSDNLPTTIPANKPRPNFVPALGKMPGRSLDAGENVPETPRGTAGQTNGKSGICNAKASY